MASKLDDIIERISNSDKSAVADLYAMRSARLYGIICHTTADSDAARLALHDTFTDVWRDRSSRKNVSDGHEDWLIAIAHRCAGRYRASFPEKSASADSIDTAHRDTDAVKQFSAKYGIQDNDLEFLISAYFSNGKLNRAGKRQSEDPTMKERLGRISDLFGKTRT